MLCIKAARFTGRKEETAERACLTKAVVWSRRHSGTVAWPSWPSGSFLSRHWIVPWDDLLYGAG